VQNATKHNPQPEPEPEPETPDKARRQWRNSVVLRWVTSFIVIPFVLVFVWFGGWWAFAGVLLVVLLGSYELHTMMRHAGYHPMTPISLGLSIVFLVAAIFPAQRTLLLQFGLSAALVLAFCWLFFRKHHDGALIDWALTLAIAIYLGLPMSYFIQLRGNVSSTLIGPHGFSLFLPRGVWWLLMVLLGVWGFDTAAFFSGHYFGRHKLAPHISPAKTWEGVCGGLVFSIVAALILTVGPLGVPWYLAILLGILVGGAAVLGDLAESLLKRQTHVKDSGQIMPGHGGMLDRIDSLLFAVIVVYFFAQLVGL
jgi:phosphatidate cytidylyltransferase